MANSFEQQLRDIAARTMFKIDAGIGEIVLGVGASLVERSPVGDPALWASKPPKGYEGGKFKANWQGGIDAINYLTTEDIDPSGETSIASIASCVPDTGAAGHVFYITNSLPYAQVLEDGSQSKQVPPGGMVGLTVIDYKNITIAAISKVNV